MKRRLYFFAAFAVLSIFADGFCVSTGTLTLKSAGRPRTLSGPIFGASTTAFFEHLLKDPAKAAALKTMAIGLDRFPGGSDANFYNWRTGLIEVPASTGSSAYVRFWAKAAANIARGMPEGVTFEQYEALSRQIGAEIILVPNLETSTVDEQKEWLKRLARKGMVPRRIELGNEFWVAMGNDPASLARWPDEPSSMRTMKQYLYALKPYLPADVKVAVQAAAGAVDVKKGKFWQRLQQWDEDLRPEPWFDAVTLHLYPQLNDVMGDPRAGMTAPTRENGMARLNAMMARVDEGTERILQDIEGRLPGKEIWITEWNTRGANTAVQRGGDSEPTFPGMEMLTAARMSLVYLRHPAVTASLFFMYSFRPRDSHAMFVPDGKGGYAPVPTATALRWLSEAANAGGTFERLVREGAEAVPGGGAKKESYLPVEGGFFESPEGATLLVENASPDTFSLDPSGFEKGRPPDRVESITTPDLFDPSKKAAIIESQYTQRLVSIPPFSLTRLVWSKK